MQNQTQARELRAKEMTIMWTTEGLRVLMIDDCEVDYMPFTYPQYPYRLKCRGADFGGFETYEEIFDFYADSIEKLIIYIRGRKFVAYPAR